MASKIKDYPIDKDGNLSTYINSEWDYTYNTHVPLRRVAIEPFIETMTFHSIEQGRSSLRAILKDSQDRTWSLFANSMEEFFKNSINGVLKGEFIVGKRGANYGLIMNEVL